MSLLKEFDFFIKFHLRFNFKDTLKMVGGFIGAQIAFVTIYTVPISYSLGVTIDFLFLCLLFACLASFSKYKLISIDLNKVECFENNG